MGIKGKKNFKVSFLLFLLSNSKVICNYSNWLSLNLIIFLEKWKELHNDSYASNVGKAPQR